MTADEIRRLVNEKVLITSKKYNSTIRKNDDKLYLSIDEEGIELFVVPIELDEIDKFIELDEYSFVVRGKNGNCIEYVKTDNEWKTKPTEYNEKLCEIIVAESNNKVDLKSGKTIYLDSETSLKVNGSKAILYKNEEEYSVFPRIVNVYVFPRVVNNSRFILYKKKNKFGIIDINNGIDYSIEEDTFKAIRHNDEEVINAVYSDLISNRVLYSYITGISELNENTYDSSMEKSPAPKKQLHVMQTSEERNLKNKENKKEAKKRFEQYQEEHPEYVAPNANVVQNQPFVEYKSDEINLLVLHKETCDLIDLCKQSALILNEKDYEQVEPYIQPLIDMVNQMNTNLDVCVDIIGMSNDLRSTLDKLLENCSQYRGNFESRLNKIGMPRIIYRDSLHGVKCPGTAKRIEDHWQTYYRVYGHYDFFNNINIRDEYTPGPFDIYTSKLLDLSKSKIIKDKSTLYLAKYLSMLISKTLEYYWVVSKEYFDELLRQVILIINDIDFHDIIPNTWGEFTNIKKSINKNDLYNGLFPNNRIPRGNLIKDCKNLEAELNRISRLSVVVNSEKSQASSFVIIDEEENNKAFIKFNAENMSIDEFVYKNFGNRVENKTVYPEIINETYISYDHSVYEVKQEKENTIISFKPDLGIEATPLVIPNCFGAIQYGPTHFYIHHCDQFGHPQTIIKSLNEMKNISYESIGNILKEGLRKNWQTSSMGDIFAGEKAKYNIHSNAAFVLPIENSLIDNRYIMIGNVLYDVKDSKEYRYFTDEEGGLYPEYDKGRKIAFNLICNTRIKTNDDHYIFIGSEFLNQKDILVGTELKVFDPLTFKKINVEDLSVNSDISYAIKELLTNPNHVYFVEQRYLIVEAKIYDLYTGNVYSNNKNIRYLPTHYSCVEGEDTLNKIVLGVSSDIEKNPLVNIYPINSIDELDEDAEIVKNRYREFIRNDENLYQIIDGRYIIYNGNSLYDSILDDIYIYDGYTIFPTNFYTSYNNLILIGKNNNSNEYVFLDSVSGQQISNITFKDVKLADKYIEDAGIKLLQNESSNIVSKKLSNK